jgi:dephospho-CoA kinase
MNEKSRVIGLTGTNGSGKGEAVAFFAARGFAAYSLSDIIRDELRKSVQTVTRSNLIKAGNRLRREGGPAVLARRTLERITGPTVIDSIRNPAEIELLRARTRFTLLAIDAPVETRYARVLLRGRDESAGDLEEFKAREAEEKSGDPAGQQLQTCFDMADFVVINDGALEEFHRRLEVFL